MIILYEVLLGYKRLKSHILNTTNNSPVSILHVNLS